MFSTGLTTIYTLRFSCLYIHVTPLRHVKVNMLFSFSCHFVSVLSQSKIYKLGVKCSHFPFLRLFKIMFGRRIRIWILYAQISYFFLSKMTHLGVELPFTSLTPAILQNLGRHSNKLHSDAQIIKIYPYFSLMLGVSLMIRLTTPKHSDTSIKSIY